MSEDGSGWCIGLYVDTPDELSAWLQKYLFFQKARNREDMLEIMKRGKRVLDKI